MRNPVLLTLPFLFLSPSAHALKPEKSFEKLTPYYEEVTEGLITPVAPNLPDDYPAQDYYKFDVSRFIEMKRSPDFLSAKRDFYGALPFNTVSQKHKRPYYFMQSWTSLFHPPIKRLEKPTETYNANFPPTERAEKRSHYFNPDFQRRVDALSTTGLTAGNELVLLPNSAGYKDKVRLASESKRYYWGVVMVFFCHETGRDLADVMIQKKKEGVDVRLIVEGLWSTVIRKCLTRMEDAGIPVLRVSSSIKPETFAGVMHHKFWIRDGEEAIIGGQNMHDYSNYSDGFNALTRDTDMRVRGPLVTDLAVQYMEVWNKYAKDPIPSLDSYAREIDSKLKYETEAGLRGADNYERWLRDPRTRMKGLCRVLVQRPYLTEHAIGPVLELYASHARESIYLSSPSVRFQVEKNSLAWQDRFAQILKNRGADGVQVNVVTNGLAGGAGEFTNIIQTIKNVLHMPEAIFYATLEKLDMSLRRSGSKKNRERLLDLARVPNVRGWNYFQYIHAKQYLFDRIVTGLGSFNFDSHSGERNHESTALCMDEGISEQIENQFTLDLVNSIPVVSSNGRVDLK